MDDQWNQNPNGGTPADPNAGQAPTQDPGTGAPAVGGFTPPAQPDPNAGVQTPPAPDPVPAPEPAQPAWNSTPTPAAPDPVQAPAQPTTGTWDQGNQGDNSGTNQSGVV